MQVISIDIKELFGNGMHITLDGMTVHKSTATLAISQALSGSYEVSLDGSRPVWTGTGGIFIAPSGVTQEIVHHFCGGDKMTAQWVFLDILINQTYRMEELFDFPVLLPAAYQDEMQHQIETIRFSHHPCRRYIAAYRIIEILMEVGSEKQILDSSMRAISNFVSANYNTPIKAVDIALHMHCSVPQIYRKIKKFFHLSPANYINSVRLQHAAQLLESGDSQIKAIALSVGFDDAPYFSRLFKNRYGLSPAQYRRQYRS